MVIDLGERWDEPDVPTPPWSRRRRRKVGAVLALVALLAAGGSAPVRSGLVSVTIQATAADQIIVEDDALYLMRPNTEMVGGGLRTFAMYRLPEATLAWQVTLSTAGAVRGMFIVDRMLLATAEGHHVQTIAVRTDTGKEVWRRLGWVQHAGTGHVLLLENSSVMVQHIFSVELETGHVRWSLSFSGDEPVLSGPRRLVQWTRSGVARVYDADTGALHVSAHLPPAEPGIFAQVVKGLLLVPTSVRERPVVTAYALDRLDRRWQADIDLSMEYVNGDCGDALCVGNPSGGLRVVDTTTGRTLWSATGWGYAYRIGPYLVAHGLSETPMPRTAVFDPADGDVVHDFGEWNASPPADDGRMLGIRERGAHVVVARIDLLALETHFLAVLTGVHGCQPQPKAVICRQGNGSVGVWRPRR